MELSVPNNMGPNAHSFTPSSINEILSVFHFISIKKLQTAKQSICFIYQKYSQSFFTFSQVITMDVYISEEYVTRRRMEKKAAAVAGKDLRYGFYACNRPEKRKSIPQISESRPENEFRVTSGGVYESCVFQCFSP
ncbi:uncharacterized protein LOC108858643 [Raphanus sativus]|uniref:Uncharacterized protein LOC108858643 n=1 Tax=Raphanus sativus TaxID=3726 RepID=A0A6J0NWB8_RAPSA|nr:uncharacterized protein LOC108858643 [Raphanus sativus]